MHSSLTVATGHPNLSPFQVKLHERASRPAANFLIIIAPTEIYPDVPILRVDKSDTWSVAIDLIPYVDSITEPFWRVGRI